MALVWDRRRRNVGREDERRKEKVHGCAPDADKGVEIGKEDAVEFWDTGIGGCD